MKRQFPNFYVNPFTVIYIAIALILGRFYFLFIHLFVALIHELFHVLPALIFKMKVKEIEMLPFGFYASISDLEEHHPLKQIVVLLLGPLSIFISLIILKSLYVFDVISIYGYNHGVEASISILIFNLLPIYPLDGNRIINAILSLICEESITKIICIFISSICSILMSIYLFKQSQIIITVFLLINGVKYILNSYQNYRNFLLIRAFDNKKRKVKISSKPRIYRHYDNYCFIENRLINEGEIIRILMNRMYLKLKK